MRHGRPQCGSGGGGGGNDSGGGSGIGGGGGCGSSDSGGGDGGSPLANMVKPDQQNVVAFLDKGNDEKQGASFVQSTSSESSRTSSVRANRLSLVTSLQQKHRF